MWRTVQRSVVIVVASAALGLAVNAVSPRHIPYIAPPKKAADPSEFLPLPEAYRLWRSGSAFFLDARAPADYEAGHIANAFNLPADSFNEHFPRVAPYLSANAPIICYCDGVVCDLSHNLVELLRQNGFKNLHILQNGWTVWSQAGYPTGQGAQP